MEEHQNDATEELSVAREAQRKEWRKPVLTIIQANSAENGPGSFPDFGLDYS